MVKTFVIMVLKKLGYRILRVTPSLTLKDLETLTFPKLTQLMNGIAYFKDKEKFYKLYELNGRSGTFSLKPDVRADLGGELQSLVEKYGLLINFDRDFLEDPFAKDKSPTIAPFEKIHYGCVDTIFEDWLNVDITERKNSPNYLKVNLLEKHPFYDENFSFGFAEDVLEHFGQADSLIFLSEAYRTLRKSGMLRLSFPGLEGVLKKHYNSLRPLFCYEGKVEAYLIWDHMHFYSRAELITIARHIGFEEVNFVEYGKSIYKELVGLDTRFEQIGLNTYVELVK
jgi:predicted SAM-dependent methyltransferase